MNEPQPIKIGSLSMDSGVVETAPPWFRWFAEAAFCALRITHHSDGTHTYTWVADQSAIDVAAREDPQLAELEALTGGNLDRDLLRRAVNELGYDYIRQ